MLGNYADPGMEIEIALRKFDLPHEFSRRAEAQAQALPESVREEDAKGRRDLRELRFVTIDGETAKDFDDAVYAVREGKGFRLWVAIADVSHYVRDGDALDQDARERGTSVYFPRRVIPMLPEKLSNGLCSLNPDVDRLAMVCEMAITHAGRGGALRVLPGGVPLARAPHLHRGVGEALGGQGAGAPRRRCTSCSRCCTRRAAGAARSTSRPSRRAWCSTRAARSSASSPSRATTRTA